jgi:hypothetical protein
MSFDPLLLLRFFHLLFAFAYVSGLALADWNSGAALRARTWRERATLLRVNFIATTVIGLGGLLLLGIAGNVLSVSLGYRMGADAWMRWVNGLWVLATVLLAAVSVPAAGTLARMATKMSEAAEGTAAPDAWAGTLTRWRIARVAQNLLFLALLVLMVFRWRG